MVLYVSHKNTKLREKTSKRKKSRLRETRKRGGLQFRPKHTTSTFKKYIFQSTALTKNDLK